MENKERTKMLEDLKKIIRIKHSEPVPDEVKEHIKKYDANYEKIRACEKGSTQHKRLLKKEKELFRAGILLRRKHNCLAADPCTPKMKCYNKCIQTMQKDECRLTKKRSRI